MEGLETRFNCHVIAVVILPDNTMGLTLSALRGGGENSPPPLRVLRVKTSFFQAGILKITITIASGLGLLFLILGVSRIDQRLDRILRSWNQIERAATEGHTRTNEILRYFVQT